MKTTVQAVINVEVVHETPSGLEQAIKRIESDGAHLNVSSWIEGGHFFIFARPGAIAFIHSGPSESANARLIAAAPDLLEELKNMATQYGCECGTPHCRRCENTLSAQAAIAKAEGRT